MGASRDLRSSVPWAKQWHARTELLRQLDAGLDSSPHDIGLQLERAHVLRELGLRADAIRAYLAVLQRDRHHYDAMLRLGALLGEHGDLDAARAIFAEAALRHPDRAAPRASLGDVLVELGDETGARTAYEAALEIDPQHQPAHRGLGPIYERAGEHAAAELAWRAGFPDGSPAISPYRGPGEPVRVLVLMSALGGNIPLQHVLDDRVFQWSQLFVEAYRHEWTLSPHALLFNAIGDADRCAAALAHAERVIERSSAPVVNRPALIRQTGRVEVAERLRALADVVTPQIARFPRAALEAPNGPVALASRGFGWPLLLRSPGFHTGEHFSLVEDAAQLAPSVAALPGDELLALAYLDTAAPDGTFRKYRVMLVDGALYPLHLAIAHQWKVHYFSAAMHDDATFRHEERAFLDDMPAAIGGRAVAALGRIAHALGVEYAGVDFALDRDGRLVLFEANATMVILPPAADERWTYRRAPVEAALQAVRAMMLRRANLAAAQR